MKNLYYRAPTDEAFEEVKEKAIDIWKTYDNTHGYVDEKTSRIKDMKNISDNMMYIIAMFDINNQKKLSQMLNLETLKQINERMEAGGNSPEFNPFLNN